MSIEKDTFAKVYEVLLDDPGVFGAMQALEQISCLVYLKYLSECDFKNLYCKGDDAFGNLESLICNRLYDKTFDVVDKEFFSVLQEWESTLAGDVFHVSFSHILSSISNRVTAVETMHKVFGLLSGLKISGNTEAGKAFEDLIRMVVRKDGQAGQFYSPRAILEIVAEVLLIKERCGSIYDPALGTGGFLVKAFNKVVGGASSVAGFEINPVACLIAVVNMILQGVPVEGVRLGSALDELNVGGGEQYDIVFANPPFSRLSGEKNIVNPSNIETSDALFVDHVFDKLKLGGSGAAVVPNRFLFDQKKPHVKLKKKLLNDGNLHTILKLPSGVMLPYTAAKLSIVFFDKKKTKTKDIWVYDLSLKQNIPQGKDLRGEDFEDFFRKFSTREDSECSWLLDASELDDCLNLDIGRPSHVGKDSLFEPISLISQLREKLELVDAEYKKLLAWFDAGDLLASESLEVFSIESIFKTKTGSRLFSKSDIGAEGDVPVYGGNGIIGYCGKYNVKGENIIIGRVGGLAGNIHYVNGYAWITDNAFYLELKNPRGVFLPYLAKMLKAANLNRVASGTAQPSISYSKIKDIKISLPSMEKQMEINERLEKLFFILIKTEKELENQLERISDLKKGVDEELFALEGGSF